MTRAEPEASRTCARIDANGGQAVLAPLLSIVPNAKLDRDLSGVQAVLFTSANGVRAFGAPKRDVRALAVGVSTAAAARDIGFGDVVTADGDSHALIALALGALDPGAGRVVHVSGVHVAGDVAGELAKAGFAAERRIAYEAVAEQRLPQSLAVRLGSDPPDLDRVLFHSARAAEVFLQLARAAAPKLTAVCISDAVAQAAGNSPWARVIVAEKAREDALLTAALAP